MFPRLFYHLKKVMGNTMYVKWHSLIWFQDLFPWVYFNYYVSLLLFFAAL